MPSSTIGEWGTMQADPWSEYGYSQYDHNALPIRREWMKMMGLAPEEIDRNCEDDDVGSLDEELRNYNAMFAVQELNAAKDRAAGR